MNNKNVNRMTVNEVTENIAPYGCTHPNCPNDVSIKCTSSLFTECPARLIEDFNIGYIDTTPGCLWYPTPRSINVTDIEEKRFLLTYQLCNPYLEVISESIFINAKDYPYVFVRITVGGIKSFKKGATYSVSIKSEDNRIWSVGVHVRNHDYKNECVVIGENSITVVDKLGQATRHPADYKLRNTFISCEYYPYQAMPTIDAVRLSEFYKPRTVISKRLFKKMLALTPRITEDLSDQIGNHNNSFSQEE